MHDIFHARLCVTNKNGFSFHLGLITMTVDSLGSLLQASTRLCASPSIAFARGSDRRGPHCVSILVTPAPYSCRSPASLLPLSLSLSLSFSAHVLRALAVTFAQPFDLNDNDNDNLSIDIASFYMLSTFRNELLVQLDENYISSLDYVVAHSIGSTGSVVAHAELSLTKILF